MRPLLPQADAHRIAILIYELVSFPKNTPLTRTYIKCSFSLERPLGEFPGIDLRRVIRGQTRPADELFKYFTV